MTLLENSVRSLVTALATLEAKIDADLTKVSVAEGPDKKILESLQLQGETARKTAQAASDELSDIITEAESLLGSLKT